MKGEGNQQDYRMRIYDPRLGRFLSVDPITKDYPELTPYQFASNSPVVFIDRDGLEAIYKMPDGSVYIHPPSDHLRTPIPNDVQQHGRHLGYRNNFEGELQALELLTNVIPVGRAAKVGIKVVTRGLRYLTKTKSIDVKPQTTQRPSKPTTPSKKSNDYESQGGEFSDDNQKVKDLPLNAKYNYGKYGSDFKDHAEETRTDLGIPKEWNVKPSGNDGVVRFIDPENPQSNHVRVMPGRYGSQYENSQSPYVVRYQNGTPLNAAGSPVKSSTGTQQNRDPEVHVPLSDFKF